MNERPLDELIAEAIDRARERADRPLSREQLVDAVLQDPDIRLLLDGYRMHDRAEGLEGVIERDVRRKVDEILRYQHE